MTSAAASEYQSIGDGEGHAPAPSRDLSPVASPASSFQSISSLPHAPASASPASSSSSSPLPPATYGSISGSAAATTSSSASPESSRKPVAAANSAAVSQLFGESLRRIKSDERVQQWLKQNKFDKSVQDKLADFTGEELLELSKEDVKQLVGVKDGIRLYSRLRQIKQALESTLESTQEERKLRSAGEWLLEREGSKPMSGGGGGGGVGGGEDAAAAFDNNNYNAEGRPLRSGNGGGGGASRSSASRSYHDTEDEEAGPFSSSSQQQQQQRGGSAANAGAYSNLASYASVNTTPSFSSVQQQRFRETHGGHAAHQEQCNVAGCGARALFQCSGEHCTRRLCRNHGNKDLLTSYVYCAECQEQGYLSNIGKTPLYDVFCKVQ